MHLHWIDWLIILAYAVIAIWISLKFTEQASQNVEEFFIAGRKLSWWVAGTSIVATTFAVDTPLAVSGFIRSGGIYKNWIWWCVGIGGMLCVFFYAHLWRRSNLLTDVEFIELRYEGKPAVVLRVFLACYKGLLYNCITMGWVILAMTKVTDVVLQWDKISSITLLILFALGYTLLSGFWGVVLTDLVQFAIAMIGSFALAIIVLWETGGPSGLITQMKQVPSFQPQMLDMIPSFGAASEMALFTFIILISVQWWSYGQGSGYISQRLFATKTEKDSILAVLWFNIAHYVLRPWPWIVVGMASILYFPIQKGQDPELIYPKMMMKFLPIGLKGVMVASLLAAFMSTIDTHLNWGASYLVNDIYKRFIQKEASARHYVFVSRLAMVLLAAMAGVFAWQMNSIKEAWIYLAILSSGASLVGLLRWYWWRINAWSEISALLASFFFANGNLWLQGLLWMGFSFPPTWKTNLIWFYGKEAWAIRLLTVLSLTTMVWMAVTFLTSPTSRKHLEAFYQRVYPNGFWLDLPQQWGFIPFQLTKRLLGWLVGTSCIYFALFGVGYLCMAQYTKGSFLLLCSLFFLFLLFYSPLSSVFEEQKIQFHDERKNS